MFTISLIKSMKIKYLVLGTMIKNREIIWTVDNHQQCFYQSALKKKLCELYLIIT